MFKSLLGSLGFYNCGDEHTNILDLLAIVGRIFGELQKVELLRNYEKEERLAIHKKNFKDTEMYPRSINKCIC